MRLLPPPLLRQSLLCALMLGLQVLLAPFPRLQPIPHLILVLALAPRPGSPLFGALWALAAGWLLEGTLRLYPHMGGTPWADLTMVLLVGWMAGRWPVESLKGWLTRLAVLMPVHALLVHLAVRWAAGPHPAAWSWGWALLTLPLWGWLLWRSLHPGLAKGRR